MSKHPDASLTPWMQAAARRPRGRATFTRTDVKNAVKAVVESGVRVRRVEFGPDGKITVVAGDPDLGGVGTPADWSDAK